MVPANDSLSLGEHGSAGVLVQIKVLVMARGTETHPVLLPFFGRKTDYGTAAARALCSKAR